MTGLMQRILRRRSDSPEQADEQPTRTHEQPTGPLRVGLPASVSAPPPSAPSFRERGRLRRRLRYLRRARELGFRDLGGLMFDLRRFDRERPDLLQAKLEALTGLDRELRALEIALDQRRAIHELREPGIASCPHCGALHASDARFCAMCGAGLRDSRSPADDRVQGSGAERGTSPANGGEGGGAGTPWETGGREAAEGRPGDGHDESPHGAARTGPEEAGRDRWPDASA